MNAARSRWARGSARMSSRTADIARVVLQCICQMSSSTAREAGAGVTSAADTRPASSRAVWRAVSRRRASWMARMSCTAMSRPWMAV
ncbi:MAG: hypothetical protein BGN82_04615 [Alphaproteobacteria bacterium 65-7]|nr:MAG: hypothetical protein BGN82_04615 [Alphaproteobacteria bacterium 65-7]